MGTILINDETDELLCDLTKSNQVYTAVTGGKGGLGNARFKTSTNRAPRKTTEGKLGEIVKIRLELKVLADVGLLGKPNAGKSTLISKISSAKPKIADYPFTTLSPNLGVVKINTYSSFVVADIPGLIPGASDGIGLGIEFLKHLSRVQILLHLIDVEEGDSEKLRKDFDDINKELEELSIICKENNIIVISDEIYTELDFNGNYHSISHFYPEGTIISSGLSKWCGAGGWRLGTLIFPKELKIIYDSVRSLSSETFTSVSAPIQYAAVKAYTEDHSEYLNNSRTILKKVANFVYDQLSEIGIECIRPQGGFYILCDFSKIIKHNNTINNATTLCEQVLQNTGFAMLPGKNFGIEDEKLITRMAFVDFDGNKALSFMKDNTSIKNDNFNQLFPKINEGIINLKSWLKSEFLS